MYPTIVSIHDFPVIDTSKVDFKTDYFINFLSNLVAKHLYLCAMCVQRCTQNNRL